MFRWNLDKNRALIQTRNISFEEIVEAINEGLVVADAKHPNSEKYPNQRMFTIVTKNYTYLVPYVIDGNDIFLKSIIPSRKAHKLNKGSEHE
jgi:uncharacterized DUF497 family protein